MRILGAVLIIVGILFCITIVGAPFGIFLIIVGVVLAVLGGRRRTVINNVIQVSNTPHPTVMQANVSGGHDLERGAVRYDPPPLRPPEPANSRPLIDATPQPPRFSYDRSKWEALAHYDPEISEAVAAVAAFGQNYVDQFAAAYMALNDKSYLSMIADKIIATAKQEGASRGWQS
jgi:hypothetical protein